MRHTLGEFFGSVHSFSGVASAAPATMLAGEGGRYEARQELAVLHGSTSVLAAAKWTRTGTEKCIRKSGGSVEPTKAMSQSAQGRNLQGGKGGS